MKANLPKPPKPPKPFERLPREQQDQIIRYFADNSEELILRRLDHEEAELQKNWLQYACMVLHITFGFGADRCMRFIGAWKRMYRQSMKFSTREEQAEFLRIEMNKIFGDGGYPYEWVDKLEVEE